MSCSGQGNRYEILINQGADFVLTLTWNGSNGTPMNLTGYTARMMIKNSPEDVAPLIELTTENGRITLGGALGTIALEISAYDTADLTFTNALYDLELISPTGFVTRLLQGPAVLSPEITR